MIDPLEYTVCSEKATCFYHVSMRKHAYCYINSVHSSNAGIVT